MYPRADQLLVLGIHGIQLIKTRTLVEVTIPVFFGSFREIRRLSERLKESWHTEMMKRIQHVREFLSHRNGHSQCSPDEKSGSLRTRNENTNVK
jgi:hypothetical protein